MKAKATFWIQDGNEHGNYSDSIGLDIRTNLDQARKELRNWRAEFPRRNSRLILRTDVVILDK